MTVRRDGKPVYDIRMESSFEELAGEMERFDLAQRKLCIVTDSTVAPLYLDEVEGLLRPLCRTLMHVVIPAGEEYKNLDTVKSVYEALILKRFDRKDMLVALGGGVVGDLCGFTAATYLRGISFVQIPTTLLSQVDSSIGGKTGVDFDAYKNMVGAFHMPSLVYTNVGTLRTLTKEQYSSGMGEIIKHGLIKDQTYYGWLAEHRQEILALDMDVCQEASGGGGRPHGAGRAGAFELWTYPGACRGEIEELYHAAWPLCGAWMPVCGLYFRQAGLYLHGGGRHLKRADGSLWHAGIGVRTVGG